MTARDLDEIAVREAHHHSDECLLAVIDDTPCICGGPVPLTVAERDALVQMARQWLESQRTGCAHPTQGMTPDGWVFCRICGEINGAWKPQPDVQGKRRRSSGGVRRRS